jgi:hypothetical protein
MSYWILGYLPAYVLGGCVATVSALLIGVHRGLKGAGWADRDRKMALGMIAALLTAWFFAALIPARAGFYHQTTSGIPTIQFGLVIPLVAGVVLFLRSSLLRRIVDAVPQTWMAGVQLFRVMGVIFLILYSAGKLPGVFAQPAGFGDVAVGLVAPVIGMAYLRRPEPMTGWLRAWNLLGISDLIIAVTTGFLTSPSKLQLFALDHPNQMISAFPLVMIPVFLVPLAVLLHLASLKKLSAASKQLTAKSDRERPSSGVLKSA